MDERSWLAVAKYAALAVTSVLAVLGLAVRTHDETTHRLTRWGRYTLAVLGVPTGVLAFRKFKNLHVAFDKSQILQAF
jgi:hypothetical protein